MYMFYNIFSKYCVLLNNTPINIMTLQNLPGNEVLRNIIEGLVHISTRCKPISSNYRVY